MHEFARISQAIIHGAAQSEKRPDPSINFKRRPIANALFRSYVFRVSKKIDTLNYCIDGSVAHEANS